MLEELSILPHAQPRAYAVYFAAINEHTGVEGRSQGCELRACLRWLPVLV